MQEEEADDNSGFSEESQLLSSVYGKCFALQQMPQSVLLSQYYHRIPIQNP